MITLKENGDLLFHCNGFQISTRKINRQIGCAREKQKQNDDQAVRMLMKKRRSTWNVTERKRKREREERKEWVKAANWNCAPGSAIRKRHCTVKSTTSFCLPKVEKREKERRRERGGNYARKGCNWKEGNSGGSAKSDCEGEGKWVGTRIERKRNTKHRTRQWSWWVMLSVQWNPPYCVIFFHFLFSLCCGNCFYNSTNFSM